MNHSNSGTALSQNKRQRKKHFNLLDVLIILLALFIIATVFYIFAPFSWIKKMTKNETRTLHYTVEILGVEESFLQNIQENQIVIDSVSKNKLGTITAVDYNTKYSELQFVEVDGKPAGVLAEYPDLYNVTVTIQASADYIAEEGYLVNHCRIAVGEKMSLRFPDFVCEGYCIGLNAS